MMRFSTGNRTQPLVEKLEARQLFSASGAIFSPPTIVSAISPEVKLKLGPSAVEGTYKGESTGFNGVSYVIKLVLTSTSARLTFEGLGTYAAPINAKQFKSIREGTFAVEFVGVGGAKGSVAFVGGVKDSGLKITGDYTNSAKRSGTFILKKA
jgi:hypothetical protein